MQINALRREQLKQYIKSQGFKKYFSNFSFLATERLIRLALALFVGAYVARYLGPRDFGILSYGAGLTYILGSLAALGIDAILIKELVSNEFRENQLLGTTFIIRLLSSLTSFIILYLYLLQTNIEQQSFHMILIMGVSLFLYPFYAIDCYFQSKVLSRYVVYIQTLQQILSALIKLALIYFKLPLFYFGLVMAIDTIIMIIGLIYIYIRKGKSLLNWSYDQTIAKTILKKSLPLLLSAITASLYLRIDQVMIKEILGAADAGQYAVAIRISEAWYFVPLIIISSIFPAIVNSKRDNESVYKKRVQDLYYLMVIIGLVVAIPLTFTANPLVTTIFGNEYSLAADVLKLHIWGGIFSSLGFASSKWFITENLQRFLFLRSLLGAILNILLNLLFIKSMGIMGAAMATVCAQVSANYLFDIFPKPTRESFIMKSKALALFVVINQYKNDHD